MKRFFVLGIFMIFLLTFVSAESIDFSKIDVFVSDYNSGSIDICQFVSEIGAFFYSEIESLEKRGHFKGFSEGNVEEMFGEENRIIKETNDFGLRIEPYKNDEDGSYIIIWGLQRSQKIIDEAVLKAEESYVDERLSEGLKKEEVVVDVDIEDVICKAEYEGDMKIRRLFEESISDFPEWYFGEFDEGVERYFPLASSHEYLAREILNNKRAVDSPDSCVTDLIGYGEIYTDYEEEGAKFKIWEEGEDVYYQFYYMPSKEIIRDIIEYKIEDPNEIVSNNLENSKNSRMNKIQKLSDRYGGSFDAILRIKDGEDDLLYKHVKINPEVVIESKTISTEPEDIDVVVEVDYDDLYDFMEYIYKDIQGTDPINADWKKNDAGSNSMHFFGIMTKSFTFFIKGVRVKPFSEIPKLLINLQLILEALGD